MSKETCKPSKIVGAAMGRTLGGMDTMRNDGLNIPETVQDSVRKDLKMLKERFEPMDKMFDEMREMSRTGMCEDVAITDAMHDWMAYWTNKFLFESEG